MPSLTSSYRQWPLQGLCEYVRWYGCAGANRQVATVAQAAASNRSIRRLMFICVSDAGRLRRCSWRRCAHARPELRRRKFVDPAGLVDADASQMALREATNTGDIGEGDGNPLCSRDVYAGNTCHVSYSFSLRVMEFRPFFHKQSPRHRAIGLRLIRCLAGNLRAETLAADKFSYEIGGDYEVFLGASRPARTVSDRQREGKGKAPPARAPGKSLVENLRDRRGFVDLSQTVDAAEQSLA